MPVRLLLESVLEVSVQGSGKDGAPPVLDDVAHRPLAPLDFTGIRPRSKIAKPSASAALHERRNDQERFPGERASDVTSDKRDSRIQPRALASSNSRASSS